ncbi:MAG: methyltransferase domain-containing protein [Pseudomonadota bacterium]
MGKGSTTTWAWGEALPYADGAFDHVVCVDVLEHVQDLAQVCREVARVLKPGGLFLFDTINRTPFARLAVITAAEDVLGLLPKGTHDPEMFIKPAELNTAFEGAGLRMEKITGLGPRGINRRGDPVFGRLPFTFILYMGHASKVT